MNSDTLLTAVFLAVILAYAVTEAVRLYRRLAAVEREVGEAAEAVSGGRSVDDAFDTASLAEPWERYRATFLELAGGREKTDARATDYFGEGEVLSQAMSLRYWLAVPNVLVGLGILGTFVGLAFGISGFEMETVDAVRESITGLLSGMATAFYTSIAGMLASILFGMYEKARFRRVDNALRGLSDLLDERYHITTVDRLKYSREDQARLLASLFGYRTAEGPVRPGDALQAIRHEAEQQTVALKQFSTDLADGIMLSTATIEALGGRLGQAFDAAMKATLAPTLEGVQQAVEKLQEEKASSNEAMVENVVTKLEASLMEMGKQFQGALSGGALDQLKEVAEGIANAHDSLKELPAANKKLMEEVRETFAASRGEITQEVAATSARLRGEAERTVTEFGAAIAGLQQQTAALLTQQGATTETATKLTASVSQVLLSAGQAATDLRGATAGVQAALGELEAMAATMRGATGNLSESSGALRDTMTAFGQDSKGWLDANRASLQALREALAEASRVGADYAAKFGVIEGGLKGVFQELQEGLDGYQSSTKEQLTNHLKDFSSHLTTAATALSGSVQTLDDSLGALVDAVEKAGRPGGNGRPTVP